VTRSTQEHASPHSLSRVNMDERCKLADAMRSQRVEPNTAVFEDEGRLANLLDNTCE
jgi:hypothetical protein